MWWVLPGGAVLDGGERAAVRPGVGVGERVVPRRHAAPAGELGVGSPAVVPAPDRPRPTTAERLVVAKLVVEVAAVVVGLVGAVLALFGGSRR